MNSLVTRPLKWLGYAAGAGLASYASYAARIWLLYGDRSCRDHVNDALLDQFIPDYEVCDRRSIEVLAPAAVVYAAASNVNLRDCSVIRALFKTREVALGGHNGRPPASGGLVETARQLGWGVLAEVPGRRIIIGAIARPWQADVDFHRLPPEQFRDFCEPGFCKIVWTIEADALAPESTLALTETRVITTDAFSRKHFRRYWAFVSPGSVLIRLLLLRNIKRAAEKRYQAGHPSAIPAGRNTTVVAALAHHAGR